jgi:hypothetical protein
MIAKLESISYLKMHSLTAKRRSLLYTQQCIGNSTDIFSQMEQTIALMINVWKILFIIKIKLPEDQGS